MRWTLIGSATVLAALAAVGCAQQQLDIGKATKLIQRTVEEQVEVKVASIACPKEVHVEASATFTCTVTGKDGTKGVVSVTQADGKGTIRVAAPFLLQPAESIQSDLRTRSPRATVDCPDIIAVKKGSTFVCRANLGEINATVTATQTDAVGNFTYNVKG